MKKLLICLLTCVMVSVVFSACSRKSGCPADGRSTGAEKLLNDEKPPKSKKFKD